MSIQTGGMDGVPGFPGGIDQLDTYMLGDVIAFEGDTSGEWITSTLGGPVDQMR